MSDAHRHSDAQCMALALRLAQRGQGRVEPNPMVGCVLARDGIVLAQGWHRRFGGPHAEINALAHARHLGIDPASCDWFVTLEPCSHHGKTPPCADALAQLRPRRVVVAAIDPFPLVAGRGIQRLRDAGIPVEVGLLQEHAQALIRPFMQRVLHHRPWVIAKWAQTLDGRIATAAGDSRWISGETSRNLVHRTRARVDAILIGIGTALADDPALTARDVPLRRVARRVVVDPRLQLPDSSQLLRSLADPGAPPLTLAVHASLLDPPCPRAAQLQARGVEVLGLPPLLPSSPRLDLRPLLEHLAQQHAATNVLVEGGGRLVGSLLEQNLVNQVLAFVAPRLLGDPAAPACAHLTTPPARIDQCQRLRLQSMRKLGPDVLLDYLVDSPPEAPASPPPESPGHPGPGERL